jgi:hypothetical protein
MWGNLAGVTDDLVPDALWSGSRLSCRARPPRRYRYPGRKRADDRAALAGIVFMLKTGMPSQSSGRSWDRRRGEDPTYRRAQPPEVRQPGCPA